MGAPVVLQANRYQFLPGQELENPCVGSRMLLWCLAGQGEVEVDGQRRVLRPDAWLLLPWRHRVRYRADRRRPFTVAGIHLCPDHDPDAPFAARAPHLPDDPLHRVPYRRDAHWPGLAGLPGGDLAEHPRLRQLAEWIVERCIAAPPDAAQARAMGLLLGDELTAAASRGGAQALPAPLAEALRAARRELHRPLRLETLAATVGCSRATLVRLFRAHLHRSPMAWLRAARLEEARRLLATTALPVAEIGARVGIPDPRRFARLFRTATGAPPRRWRVQRRL